MDELGDMSLPARNKEQIQLPMRLGFLALGRFHRCISGPSALISRSSPRAAHVQKDVIIFIIIIIINLSPASSCVQNFSLFSTVNNISYFQNNYRKYGTFAEVSSKHSYSTCKDIIAGKSVEQFTIAVGRILPATDHSVREMVNPID